MQFEWCFCLAARLVGSRGSVIFFFGGGRGRLGVRSRWRSIGSQTVVMCGAEDAACTSNIPFYTEYNLIVGVEETVMTSGPLCVGGGGGGEGKLSS